MTRPKWIDPELHADRTVHTKCGRCGAPVLKARAGRVMALDVLVDTEPVLDDSWARGRLLWCLHGKRLLWRDHKRCGHIVLADHVCDDRRTEMVDESDPFGIDKADEEKSMIVRGRYKLPNPETGKPGSWQRTSNFAGMLKDTFHLEAWKIRKIITGVAGDPELVERIRGTEDSGTLDDIAAEAKDAAGGNDAAALGTRLHKRSELWDQDRSGEIEPEYLPRVAQYGDALARAGIRTHLSLIERVIVHPGYGVAGRFDRIVQLADGSWVIFDLKTGKNLDRSWLDIAIQLHVYMDAVYRYGLWNPHTRKFEKLPFEIRTDISIVAHLPSDRDGCTLYEVDMDYGHRGAEACMLVKSLRAEKNRAWVHAPIATTAANRLVADYMLEITLAPDVARVMVIRDELKSMGVWNEKFAEACRVRAKQLSERA